MYFKITCYLFLLAIVSSDLDYVLVMGGGGGGGEGVGGGVGRGIMQVFV